MMTEVHVSARPAEVLAARLASAINAAPHTTIAVSGGSTPRSLFALLAHEYPSRISWDRVTIFQVDERCVPPDHADSNWRMLRETLLDPLPAIRAHRMEAETPDGAARYEALLRGEVASHSNEPVPVLDIVLLGMGADGHTASLFPGSSALDEEVRLVVRHEVPDIGARMTLTFPVLRAARHRWFLAAGADKATAFAQARRGEAPAGQVGPSEWFIDDALAAAA